MTPSRPIRPFTRHLHIVEIEYGGSDLHTCEKHALVHVVSRRDGRHMVGHADAFVSVQRRESVLLTAAFEREKELGARNEIIDLGHFPG